MTLSGTEAAIVNCVTRCRGATKDQIRREVGFSLEYIGYICQYLVRTGCLKFAGGRYFLTKGAATALLSQETPRIDRKLLNEVAGEVAREITGELRKTVRNIKMPALAVRRRREPRESLEQVKIRTDFDLTVEDQTLSLESNITEVGTHVEKEACDIEDKIELLKKLKKRRRR